MYTEEEITSWGKRMDYMEKLGFQVVERECVKHPTLANINKEIEKWTKKVTNAINPYPVDGLVVVL